MIRKKTKHYDFQKFKTTKSFGREIFNDDTTLDYEFEEQIVLKNEINKFEESMKPQKPGKKRKIMQLYFLKESKKFLIALKVEYFQQENRHKVKDVQVS